jgi:hypothetical protein
MLHIFRRHLRSCKQFAKRTEGKCPTKPSCPIFFEGVDGNGKRHSQTKLIDPRTGNGIRDWARANEVVRVWSAKIRRANRISRISVRLLPGAKRVLADLEAHDWLRDCHF